MMITKRIGASEFFTQLFSKEGMGHGYRKRMWNKGQNPTGKLGLHQLGNFKRKDRRSFDKN
jgi:hypothetical protein